MKRKTSTKPTKIYSYACGSPTENASLVDDQIRAARIYRNKLVEIEIERRHCYRQIVSANGDAAALEARVSEIGKEIDGLRLAIKAVRKEARGRVAATEQTRARIRELGAEAKEERRKLKEARAAARTDARVAFFVAWVDRCSERAARDARTGCGVYWTTSGRMAVAVEAIRRSKTDPQFRRWDGRGSVGGQIIGGVSVPEVLGGEHPWLRISTTEEWRTVSVPRRHRDEGDGVSHKDVSFGPKRSATVRLRVGSDGRDPIWATWPVVMHRPLPEDALIKNAWVQRRRIGSHWQWQLCMTVEADFPARETGPGVAAIDIGWRLRDDRAIRVGYLIDDQGHEEEILLPGGRGGILDRLQHAESLRKIQALAFDSHRDRLVRWLADNSHPAWVDETTSHLGVRSTVAASLSLIPIWMDEATSHLGEWKSAARLQRVVERWREERFDGDGEIFAAMEAWRKQHKHLNEWEVNEREKALARRHDVYRCLAAALARRYKTVVLEDFDLRDTQKKAAPEASTPDLPMPVRYLQRVASIHEMRSCLKERVERLEMVDASGTTTTCSACQATMPSPDEALMVYCPSCKRVWDQDANSARVILQRWAASGVVPPGSGEALADDGISDLGELSEGGTDSSEIGGVA